MADDDYGYNSYEDAYDAQDRSDYQPSAQFDSMWGGQGGEGGSGGGIGGQNFDWGSWLGQSSAPSGPQAGDITAAATANPASQYSNTEMANPGSQPVNQNALTAGVIQNLPTDAQKFDYGQGGSEVPQQNPASEWGSPQGAPTPMPMPAAPQPGPYAAGDMPNEFSTAAGQASQGQPVAQAGNLPVAPQPGKPAPPQADGNPIANALKAAGGPGGLVSAATGAAGIGMMGAGLMKNVPKLKNPDFSQPTAMSPEQRSAYGAMQAQQARLQGVAQTGGTAGEQKILATMNEKLQAALKGDMETADPNTVYQLNLEEAQLQTRMANELGNGWETSTAGQNVMRNFKLYKESVLFQAKQAIIQEYSSMGLQRSQFAEGLNTQPIALSENMMGDITGMQQGQVGAKLGVGQANQAYDANTRAGLMQTGGQLAGYAAAPWMARYADQQRAKVNQ